MAAKALGVRYEYSAPPSLNNFTSDYTTLIREAIARHPAAMVVGNFIPTAFDPLIKQATRSGIPVVVEDTGLATWRSDGAIGFAGVSFASVGAAAASNAMQAGVHRLLCVDQTTNPYIEQVCTAAATAMRAAGGTCYRLNAPLDDLGNPAALTQDIQGYLASHPQIDGVFTAGSGFGADAADAVQRLGKVSSIKVGGNEVLPSTLQGIKNGTIAFEISNQPFLEGFDSLQIAAQFARYKVYPGAPIITNGAVVGRANIGQYLAVNSQHPGLLG
jgi:simple sugar transport system substrate-binding protein